MDLNRHICNELDFPDPGARSHHITPVLQNGKAFQYVDLAALRGQERPWDCERFSLVRHE